jgi:drug/metabolite transporter (DMT)-like permease
MQDDAVADDDETVPTPDEGAGDRSGGDPAEGQGAARNQLRMRRAPRYRAFGLTGALLGVAAGVVLALSFTVASDYTIQTIAGYFAAIFGLCGTVLGLALAVLIERRRPHRRS